MSEILRGRCRETGTFERPNYFKGQLLTERDLTAEQSYHLEKRRLHHRTLHGFGTVCGLRVVPTKPAKPLSVLVEPGLALDPWGREIVLPEAVEVDLRAGPQADDADVAGPGEPLYVVVAYQESLAELVPSLHDAPAPDLAGEGSYARVRESYEISLRRQPPEGHSPADSGIYAPLAAAVREGANAARLHALLCELVVEPCSPCAPDAALTLARVDLPARGAITAERIDNCTYRHLVLSMDRMLQILLGLLESEG